MRRGPSLERLSLSSSQIGVAFGVASAIFLTAGGFLLPRVWADFPMVPADIESRLSLWMVSSLPLAAWTAVGVFRMACLRYFSSQDIDAAIADGSSSHARIAQAQLHNTLEQAVVACLAYGSWWILADDNWRALPLLFVIYFSIGRILFVGLYRFGARGRAIGFGLTFYPSTALVLLLLPKASIALILAFSG